MQAFIYSVLPRKFQVAYKESHPYAKRAGIVYKISNKLHF